MEAFLLLVVWGLMCWGVAALASSRGRSGLGFFLLSFVFSPLLGLIVVLVMKNLTEESAKDYERRREEERREEDRKREHEKQLESLRVMTAAQAVKASPVPPNPPAVPSVADELVKLAALRERGVLSPEEFEEQKRRLLSR